MRTKNYLRALAGLILAAALIMTACGDAEGGPGGGGGDLAAGLYEGVINAKLVPIDISGQSGDHLLAKALEYILYHPTVETTNYTILLDENCSMDGLSNLSGNIDTLNAVVTLLGKKPVEISLSSGGMLFLISNGELVLGKNITLKGRYLNGSALVRVNGGTLIMEAGAKITDNYYSNLGGGVAVYGGSFTMTGGEISGNTGNYGGGVFIKDPGSFSKTGGIIYGKEGNPTDNTAISGGIFGHAVCYGDTATRYYRNTTLNVGDDISTAQLPASGTGYNWTKY
jgi:hypothetical protein